MNLTDLRAELTNRASEPDDRPTDLLPGVHRKITRTKRRRVATAGAAVIAIAALAFVPSLTNNTAPEPAQPPADYTKDGITLVGVDGDNRLEKGWIGREGESELRFQWTPTSHSIALYPYCRSLNGRSLVIQFNGRQATNEQCADSGTAPEHWVPLDVDNSIWLDAPVGKPIQVTAHIVDDAGRIIQDETTQLAVGLYTTPELQLPGAPNRIAPESPDDFVKNDIRYRAKVGGDTLKAATIGDRGQTTLKFRYTASGAPVSFRTFCTANTAGAGEAEYQLSIQIGGVGERGPSCGGSSTSTDAGGSGGSTLADAFKAGQTYDITVRLQDRNGKPVTMPQVYLGLGIYEKGAQRTVDGTSLDEVVEQGGYTYKLGEVKTVDATKTKVLKIDTPADKPYLITYGSSDLGPNGGTVTLGLDGEDTGGSFGSGGAGFGTTGQPAGPASAATLTLDGTATKGKLILAIYLPTE